MPVLLRAKQIARAPDLQITHRDFEPGTKLRKVSQGVQPFALYLI